MSGITILFTVNMSRGDMKTNRKVISIAFAFSVLIFSSAVYSNEFVSNEFDVSLNVVTVRTSSVMGYEIAKALSQLIYTRELTMQSSLRLRENIPSSGTREILLETPLRRLTSHRFVKSRPRSWSDPVSVAEHFIHVAQKEGILVSIR